MDVSTEYTFEFFNVMLIKTEYLDNDPSHDGVLEWGNSVYLTTSEQYPDRYFFVANDEAKTGDYTFRFYSKSTRDTIDDSFTIADIKKLDDCIIDEFQV